MDSTRAASCLVCPYSNSCSCSCCCYFCHMRSLLFMVIIYFGQPSPHLCRLFISAINIKCYDNDAVPIPSSCFCCCCLFCIAFNWAKRGSKGEGERERAMSVVSTHNLNIFLGRRMWREKSFSSSHCYLTYVIINILLIVLYLIEAYSAAPSLIFNYILVIWKLNIKQGELTVAMYFLCCTSYVMLI